MLSVVSEVEEGVGSDEVTVEGANGIRDRRKIVSKKGKGWVND